MESLEEKLQAANQRAETLEKEVEHLRTIPSDLTIDSLKEITDRDKEIAELKGRAILAESRLEVYDLCHVPIEERDKLRAELEVARQERQCQCGCYV